VTFQVEARRVNLQRSDDENEWDTSYTDVSEDDDPEEYLEFTHPQVESATQPLPDAADAADKEDKEFLEFIRSNVILMKIKDANRLTSKEWEIVFGEESLRYFGHQEKKNRATLQGAKWTNDNSPMQEPIQLQSYYAHSTLNCSCSHLQYLQDDIKRVLKKLWAPPSQLNKKENSIFTRFGNINFTPETKAEVMAIIPTKSQLHTKPKPNLTIVVPVS